MAWATSISPALAPAANAMIAAMVRARAAKISSTILFILREWRTTAASMCRAGRGGRSLRALCLLSLLVLPAAAQEKIPVAIELVLALDASASVDAQEFALQLEGLARAFADPEIGRAVENLRPFGAGVAVVQWGAPGETRTVVPFAHLQTARDTKAFGFVIGLVHRWMRASSTSIAAALDDSRLLIEANEFEGHRKVIDISGDGPDNSSADIEAARGRAGAAGITVNGLPIAAEDHLQNRIQCFQIVGNKV